MAVSQYTSKYRWEKKQSFSASPDSPLHFEWQRRSVLLQTLEKKKKKSTENPVGSRSQGGPLSCYGRVNGEATVNALMEPR